MGDARALKESMQGSLLPTSQHKPETQVIILKQDTVPNPAFAMLASWSWIPQAADL